MAFKWSTEIDHESKGGKKLPKLTRDGHYRFTLTLYNEDVTKVLGTIDGFRVTKRFEMVLPPLSTNHKGVTFPIVKLSPELMEMLLKNVKEAYTEMLKAQNIDLPIDSNPVLTLPDTIAYKE